MINLRIDLDQKDLQGFLNAAPRTIFNAQRSAIETTATFANKLLTQRMTVATGLPAAVFKQFRVFKKIQSYKDHSNYLGIVFLGYNPIKAAYVGKLSEIGAGAMAGQYYFEHGFIATMSSGHRSIFKREGAKTFRIVRNGKEHFVQHIFEQKVNLPQAEAITEQVANEAANELQRRYLEKLQATLK